MSNSKAVQWVSISEAVALLGTSRRTLFRMIKEGRINTTQIDRKRLIEVRPVEASPETETTETRVGMLAMSKSNDQLQQALIEARAAWRDAEARIERAQSTLQRWAATAAALALIAGATGTAALWQRENAKSANDALFVSKNTECQTALTLAQAKAETEKQRETFDAILAGWIQVSPNATTNDSVGTMTLVDCESN